MKKTALVTGASRGIGKAVALRLAKDGYNIAVNYNKNDALALEAVNEIKSLGVEAASFKADTSNIDEVKSMFREVQKQFGGVDVLVNNAGVVDDAYLLMVRQDSLERSLDINIKGYINCAQQAALKMLGKRSGKIINISSVSSVLAVEGQSVYSATKGIQVNAVAPGFIGTDMIKSIPKELAEKYIEAVPMKKFGTSEDVANVVSALCSDSFAYMTGQVLVLDGGLSL